MKGACFRFFKDIENLCHITDYVERTQKDICVFKTQVGRCLIIFQSDITVLNFPYCIIYIWKPILNMWKPRLKINYFLCSTLLRMYIGYMESDYIWWYCYIDNATYVFILFFSLIPMFFLYQNGQLIAIFICEIKCNSFIHFMFLNRYQWILLVYRSKLISFNNICNPQSLFTLLTN